MPIALEVEIIMSYTFLENNMIKTKKEGKEVDVAIATMLSPSNPP